jgi:hypothetical protein
MRDSDDPMQRLHRVRPAAVPQRRLLLGAGSAIAAAVTLAAALIASDARADDLAALKAELDGLKSEYASRIATLESRIAELEAKAAAASSVASTAPAPPPAAAGRATGTGTAFNPAMSVILAGTYVNSSQDPASYRIAGFVPSGGDAGPGNRSFNLGESELTLAANVDPYFFANLTATTTFRSRRPTSAPRR